MIALKRIEPTAPDDITLVDRVLNGETRAYELLMRKHNQRLYRIARTYLRDEDEIEDVMQEAYVKAYEQLPRFERRAQFSTWLIRILINEAYARLRRQKRFAQAPAFDDDESGAAQSHVPEQADTVTPMANLMNAELKNILEQAVDDLPEKYRAVFVMREIEGMNVAETGAALELTETNVKVRLNRAKGMLQELISTAYRGVDVYNFDLVRCDRIVERVMRRIALAG